jgi:hypothetical protein
LLLFSSGQKATKTYHFCNWFLRKSHIDKQYEKMAMFRLTNTEWFYLKMMLAQSQNKQHQMVGRMVKDKLIWTRNEAVEA